MTYLAARRVDVPSWRGNTNGRATDEAWGACGLVRCGLDGLWQRQHQEQLANAYQRLTIADGNVDNHHDDHRALEHLALDSRCSRRPLDWRLGELHGFERRTTEDLADLCRSERVECASLVSLSPDRPLRA